MLGVLGTSLSGCGKSDAAATELCNQYAAAICERFFTCGGDLSAGDTSASTCTPKLPKKPDWFPQEFACYTSASDCTNNMQALECGNVAETVCSRGATYHADKAQACVSGWQALSCENVQLAGTPSTQPVECSQICTF